MNKLWMTILVVGVVVAALVGGYFGSGFKTKDNYDISASDVSAAGATPSPVYEPPRGPHIAGKGAIYGTVVNATGRAWDSAACDAFWGWLALNGVVNSYNGTRVLVSPVPISCDSNGAHFLIDNLVPSADLASTYRIIPPHTAPGTNITVPGAAGAWYSMGCRFNDYVTNTSGTNFTVTLTSSVGAALCIGAYTPPWSLPNPDPLDSFRDQLREGVEGRQLDLPEFDVEVRTDQETNVCFAIVPLSNEPGGAKRRYETAKRACAGYTGYEPITTQTTATPTSSSTATPTCAVRPACLNLPNPCDIAEPAGGWCPTTNKTDTNATDTHVTATPTPSHTSTPAPTATPRSGFFRFIQSLGG